MIDLKEVEEKRSRYENEFLIIVIVGAFITTIASLYFLGNDESGSLLPIVFSFAGFLFVVFFLYKHYSSKWNRLFKSEVLAKLFKEHFQNLVFKPFNYHSRDEFKSSMLFKDYPKPDKYNGGNYIEGSYEGINFSLSWLDAKYKVTETDNKGNTHTSYRKIFKGLFIKTEFFKEIDGYVLVYPPEKTLNRKVKIILEGKVFLSSPGRQLKLDNPEFDRYFSVYASSEFEAYYVLDHAFMERLMRLKDSLGKSVRLSFQGKTLYIAIEDMDFLATPSLFRSLEELDLESYVREVKKVLEFLKELKLNQRLGTSL